MLKSNDTPAPSGTLFTIGHSNRNLNNFLEILHYQNIQQLIDVRSYPGSRRFPTFNRTRLKLALEDEGITYTWLGHELGGLRRAKSGSPHTALATDGFRGYADYMNSPAFQHGMQRLTNLARNTKVTIMCAERDPCQCHRSMIADYLILNRWLVIHLIDICHTQTHQLNPLARNQNQYPIYDQLNQEQLDLSF